MRCEECLPRIEEYVDGELDGRMMASVATHISTCGDCASQVEELRREQAIYTHYQRDVEVTPAQWNIVRARIEQEKDAGLRMRPTELRQRVASVFGSRMRFRPAFVAALVLIAIAATAGIVYFNSRSAHRDLASKPSSRDEISPANGGSEDIGAAESNEIDRTVAPQKHSQENSPDRQPTARNRPLGSKQSAVAANTQRLQNRRIKRVTPGGASRLDVMAAVNVASGASGSFPEPAGDFDFEIARHAQRAELLLRSFRNVRLSASNRRLDISFEKEQSRRLLYQNIALRREAVGRGDEPTAGLLNRLEPILLDIANLPNRAKPRDVFSIEQSMEKRQIVATLQVRTLVASNRID